MGKIKSKDFFKTRADAGEGAEPAPKPREPAAGAAGHSARPREPMVLSRELTGTLDGLRDALNAAGLRRLAASVEGLRRDAARSRFTVSVVGEFNRGKSTFLNQLLGQTLLPVGNMPTTALLTRIRYNAKEVMGLFDGQGKHVRDLPLGPGAWEGLTANNLGGRDPTGTVLLGVRSQWLAQNSLELIDTPGAGDLEESRARSIGDVLLGSDGAIIVVNAGSPLSLSEKLFIEQRLLTHKTPFLMIVVTKLDQIPPAQRADVVNYIRQKLALWREEDPKLWSADIPVYIPYPAEPADSTLADSTGLDKIRRQIEMWIADPQRVQLTEEWISAKAAAVADSALAALRERQVLAGVEGDKRLALIEEKKRKLDAAALKWEDLRLEMQKRCGDCQELLMARADEWKISISERLQYEAAHTPSPERWWTEDYPYRLKVELTNMSNGIENIVSRRISEDARQFNSSMEHLFRTHVLFQPETIADKDFSRYAVSAGELRFENVEKQRIAARVGTTVLSIAGYVACASIGVLPLVATMGIGTGATVVSEQIFKKKLDAQRADIKDAIVKNVPALVESATAESSQRLRTVYANMISAAVAQEKSWMQTQQELIENAADTGTQAAGDSAVADQISALEALRKKLLPQ